MSYLVLARKWRPRRFAELVGQEHVVRALSHALDSGRIHHAFLFTGTRGVGKTTIARIFAKSLNCEVGVGAEPCGKCAVCEAVDAGRFVDLIEIDAASNTGVDDVREVIENAQYMPTRGRYKVYLVDEVHMLSRNAFNALLKTLEEPPEHVKFLLATTDPQKLPVTVLSRCLQFNLKRLTPEQIDAQLERILGAEGITHEAGCASLLAQAADGSLRDALSLLDQAIAHGGGALQREDVAAMLGSVDAADLGAMLAALGEEDGEAMLAAVEQLATYSPDYAVLLGELAAAMHRVQVRQLVPAAADPAATEVELALAGRPPELVQLWYQMAVLGRREIEQAPTPRIGFEMVLLRMLAFSSESGEAPERGHASNDGGARRAAAEAAARLAMPAAAPRAVGNAPAPPVRVAEAAPAPLERVEVPRPQASGQTEAAATSVAGASGRRPVTDAEDWLGLVASLPLRGPVVPLAQQLAFMGDDGDSLRLSLPASLEHLRAPTLIDSLAEALAGPLGAAPRIRIETRSAGTDTLAVRHQRERDQRQRDAEDAFVAHPVVEQLVQKHGGQVVADSVRPRPI